MGELFSYSILSGIVLTACYLPYRLWMAGRKQFALNRLAICVIYALALLSPFLVFSDGVRPGNNTDIFFKAVPAVSDLMPVEKAPEKGWNLVSILTLTYAVGMACMSLLYICGLVKILMIVRRSCREKIGSTILRVTDDKNLSPFSWRKTIIVGKRIFESDSVAMVVAHEGSHIAHSHWMDLLLAQIVLIVQWYNPVAWKLRAELKELHEYQADDDVVRSGVDPLAYQEFLVSVAFSSKFNLPADFLGAGDIRKRITMMNRRNPAGLKRLAVIAVLPAFVIGVMACNLEQVKAVVEQVKSVSLSGCFGENAEIDGTNGRHTYVEAARSEGMDLKENKEFSENKTFSEGNDSLEDDGEFTDACYPGGMAALMQFLNVNLKYPAEAERDSIQGRVIISFAITADGDVKSRKVEKSVHKYLDEEAMRVSALIKKFEPAVRNGTPVASTFYLPFNFKLQKTI